MDSPYLHDNSGGVQSYYRQHCDAFRLGLQDDTYGAFIQAMKAKGKPTKEGLERYVGGVGQLWASNDRIVIDGFDGPCENHKGKFTSSCHISRDGYVFQVDKSNTSRPAHSAEERNEVVKRFQAATALLLAT